jgi:hypothetical protein
VFQPQLSLQLSAGKSIKPEEAKSGFRVPALGQHCNARPLQNPLAGGQFQPHAVLNHSGPADGFCCATGVMAPGA